MSGKSTCWCAFFNVVLQQNFPFLLAFMENNNKAYVKEQAKYHVITIWNKKIFSFIISINVRIMSMLYRALDLKTSL